MNCSISGRHNRPNRLCRPRPWTRRTILMLRRFRLEQREPCQYAHHRMARALGNCRSMNVCIRVSLRYESERRHLYLPVMLWRGAFVISLRRVRYQSRQNKRLQKRRRENFQAAAHLYLIDCTAQTPSPNDEIARSSLK
jgi:hypothetical protein